MSWSSSKSALQATENQLRQRLDSLQRAVAGASDIGASPLTRAIVNYWGDPCGLFTEEGSTERAITAKFDCVQTMIGEVCIAVFASLPYDHLWNSCAVPKGTAAAAKQP